MCASGSTRMVVMGVVLAVYCGFGDWRLHLHIDKVSSILERTDSASGGSGRPGRRQFQRRVGLLGSTLRTRVPCPGGPVPQLQVRELLAGGVDDERSQAHPVDVLEPQLRVGGGSFLAHDDAGVK